MREENQPFYALHSLPEVYALYSYGYWKAVESSSYLTLPQPKPSPQISTVESEELKLTFISQVKAYFTSLRLRFS